MRGFVIAALVLGGCSFTFVSGPPAHAPSDAPCTESRVAPIADTVIAAGAGIGGIALLAAPNNCSYANQSDCTASNVGHGAAQATGALLLLPALVYAISAVRGFSAVGECRRVHAGA